MTPQRCPSQSALLAPHGLWSLWDMLELKADDFAHVARMLQHIMTFVGAIQQSHAPSEKSIELVKEDIGKMREALKILGATITIKALNDFAKSLEGGAPSWQDLNRHAEDVDTTMRREIGDTSLLVLNNLERLWYAPPEPLFGPKFEAGYRAQGNYELAEASKCFALGRPTAAVFHLMRIMEIGLHSIRKCLSIPDPARPSQKTWGAVLGTIKGGIEAKWPHKADRMAGDGRLFDGLYASLDAVKTPLRDSTMHVESTYTESEARHIFELVKGFITKLAERCDEDGEPKAP